MQKTVNINLGGVVFTIDEDAYEELNKYLDSIKKHYSKVEGGKGIIEDIESSFALKLEDKVTTKGQIVGLNDIQEIIEVMGRVEEFEEELFDEQVEEEDTEPLKKLYKNPDDVVIAGVCSGIAAYFGIDAVFVRLAFAVSVFFGGVGVLAYLILMLVMPEAKTQAEKLEMKGAPVTLKKLEQAVKQKLPKDEKGNISVKKATNPLLQFLRVVFETLGRVVLVLAKVLGVVIGLAFMVAALAGLISLTFAFLTALFNVDQLHQYSDVPIQGLFDSAYFTLGLSALFVTILIPLILILLIGVSVLRRKNAFKPVVATILIVTWIVSASLLGAIGVKMIPDIDKVSAEIHNAEYYSEEKVFKVKDFDAIRTNGGNYRVTVTQGEEYTITAKTSGKNLDKLSVVNNDEVLTIDTKRKFHFCFICLSPRTEINITMPGLVSLDGSGATKFAVTGFGTGEFSVDLDGASSLVMESNFDSMTLDLDGASRAELSDPSLKKITADVDGASRLTMNELNAESIDLDLDGASKVTLAGEVSRLKADLDGASFLDAHDLSAEETEIDRDGAARVELGD